MTNARLRTLLRSLFATVRTACPTWEEWQVTVDLYPLATVAAAEQGAVRDRPVDARH